MMNSRSFYAGIALTSKLEQSNTVLKAQEIITSDVQVGTIQLMPSGELIVLMRDCQSTGGYARVLQLTDQAINQLAQKAAGQSISLTCIFL
jgi:allophanate hydrolase subunit 2